MERQGFEIPLLIGGATTSPAHTAVKIDPQYDGPGGLREGRLARGRRGQSLVTRRAPRRDVAAGSRTSTPRAREQHAGARRRPPGCRPSRGARQPLPHRLDGVPRRRCRACTGRAARSRTMPLDDLVPLHRLDAVLQRLGIRAASSPTSSTDPVVGEAARNLYDDAQAMLDADRSRSSWLTRAARSSASSRPTPSATTSRSTPTSRARRCVATLHHLRQQMQQARRASRTCALADFVAPRETGVRGLRRRLRRHRRPSASTSTVATFEARARRLQRHPAQGAGRPARRGASPSGCTSGCAASSGATRPTSALDNDAADPRAVPRHPPGAGLSRLPRPHREGDAVAAARRRAQRRHHADRELRDVAAAAVSGWYFSHPRGALLRGRPDRRATRWRTTRAARA